MFAVPLARTSGRTPSGRSLASLGRSRWLGRLLLPLCALSFALFVRVTLYGRVGLMEVGARGLLIPAATLVGLLAWGAATTWLVYRRSSAPAAARATCIAATFLPMLSTLPITVGVLTSESFAREYWIDRSLKVELLLGLPGLALALQMGLWTWLRYRLTWRRAGPILGVLAAGFALRYAGMGWGLPFAYQPEETSIYFRWGMEFALHDQWNPHYFQNPSLLIYLLGLEFMGLFAVGRLLQFGSDPGDLYMVFRGEQDLFYAVGRLNSVLLGTATLLLVYLVARRLWSERAGLIAAALLAVNFLHVRNSQYAVNDVPSAFFLVLSLYYAVRLFEEGRTRHYLLAGLAAGLAATAKYNAGLISVAVLAAHLARRGRGQERSGAAPLAKLALSAGAAGVGFVLGTPYAVLDFEAFRTGFLEQLAMGQAAWSGQSLAPTVQQSLETVTLGAGLPAALLALLGGALLLARDRRSAALLLSFPVAYLAFMSAMDLFFIRWVVPAMPFVALLAAYGVEWMVGAGRVLPRRQKGEGLLPGADGAPAPRPRARALQALGLGLLVLALLQPAVSSLRLDWLAHQRDTRHEANEWAARNLPPGSKVAVEAYSLLDQESLAFRPTLRELEIELVWRATMHDLDYYRRNGFQYLAVSSFMYDRAFSQPDRYADRVEFYRQLDRELTLLASFSPRADGASTPFALDDLDTPFWHLFSYDRPGPTVKVYRVGS